MPRPTPSPHPVEAFLLEHYPRRVSSSSKKKYAAILRRMEMSNKEPKAWLAEQVKELDGTQRLAARTTIGVLRSAVLYFLRWQHYKKTGILLSDEEAAVIGSQLSSSSEGERGTERTGLTDAQLELYQEKVKALEVVPQIITVLLLLPLTGLRIFEACGLKGENVIRRGKEWKLSIIGKGRKHRIVPLNDTAREILSEYVTGKRENQFLFVNPCQGEPGSIRDDLSPAQVRAAVREYLQPLEELSDVVPHVLRHQFATSMIKKETDIFTVKKLMGHSSTVTLERYTHPDEDMLRKAVEKLDK